jgi:hypothetical protein
MRGFTIAAMIMVNYPGTWDHVYPPLLHAHWNGITMTDFIFPFFLFIVGVSIAFAYSKRLALGKPKGEMYKKIIIRSIKIFAVGVFLNLIPHFDFTEVRIAGVLQRIAVVFLVCAVLFLNTDWKKQIFISAGVLLIYWLAMTLIPIPGVGKPMLEPGVNLAAQIDNRMQQLTVLENLLMNRNLQDQVMPAGRPITKGWLSSHFGVRTDPFTGKRRRHYGMDFAGAEGSDVITVGAGVVTYSGSRYAYGNMVEINHGNGFVTRYAHNKENLVEVGEVVKKGQVIAYMGATGRATGPHVHFEVLQNGKVVNPLQYIRD